MGSKCGTMARMQLLVSAETAPRSPYSHLSHLADRDETGTSLHLEIVLPLPIKYSLSLHGAALQLANSCPVLDEQIGFFLNPFLLKRHAAQDNEFHGQICPFDMAEVTHSLSRAADSERHSDGLVEIYSLAEKHWIIDDRWGFCEIDLLKHRWRSWVLPNPSLDPIQLAEAAVLWPMAQLLRTRGVEIVPALSIERAGWGALVIAPYPIPGEISRIIRAGYRVIGQRWTALVRQNGRIVLRRIPGLVQSPASSGRSIGRRPVWTDLTSDNPWASADLAWCDAVLTIAPGRRSKTIGRVIPAAECQTALRRAWPIPDLPISRPRLLHPAAVLARECHCLNLQLSRHEDEFLDLIEFTRRRTGARVQVSINNALRRHIVPTRMAG